MFIKILYLLLLLASPYSILAQEVILSGQVLNKKNGKGIKSATVTIEGSPDQSVTDKNGYYSIGVPLYKEVTVIISHIKFGRKAIKIKADFEYELPVIKLTEKPIQMAEIIITANKLVVVPDKIEHSTNFKINPQMVRQMPSLGEPDLLKTLQFLPGVQAGGDGGSAVNVRGGSSDQNLVLFEGTRIYNPTHMFGFMSTFNTDVVEELSFYKSGIPARYSGRLSSVIDIRQKVPENWHTGTFSLSPVSTSFTLGGPLGKKKKNPYFLVGFRKSWLDVLLAPFPDATKIGFGDINLSIGANNGRNKFSVSFYSSSDKVKNNYASSKQALKWNNVIGSLQLEQKMSNNFTSTIGLHYSGYHYKNVIKNKDDKLKESVETKIRDIELKWDNVIKLDPANKIRFGGGATSFSFQPQLLKSSQQDDVSVYIPSAKTNAVGYSIYLENERLLFDRLFINAGLAITGFYVNSTNYLTLEPRVLITYNLTSSLEVNATYTKMAQYIHRLTNVTDGPPVELWVPSTNLIQPQIEEQVSIGLLFNLNPAYSISIESYYKEMDNVIAVKEGEGGILLSGVSWEEGITSGTGIAKGIEFMLSKEKGRFTGWLSYTYSKSDRNFMLINNGETFPFTYDRPHDFSITTTYVVRKDKVLSANFLFSSGYNITLPEAKYFGYLPTQSATSNNVRYLVNNRNNYRLPPYHRFDIAYSSTKEKKFGKQSWIFSIYNLYSRRNPYFIYEENGQLKQFSLFPIVPTITYRIEF